MWKTVRLIIKAIRCRENWRRQREIIIRIIELRAIIWGTKLAREERDKR